MSRKFFTIFLLGFLALVPLWTSPIDPHHPDLILLRDTHLNQHPEKEEYLAFIDSLKETSMEIQEETVRLYHLATIEYFKGMYFLQNDEPKEAEIILQTSINLVEELLKIEESSVVHLLMAEVLGQKMLIGGIGSIIANYFPLEHHIKKALHLNPENLKAKVFHDLRYVHGPPILAQDLNKAEKNYRHYLEQGQEDPWFVYASLHTLGTIYKHRGKKEQALEYFLKALEIYPSNYYVLTRIEDLGYNPGDLGL